MSWENASRAVRAGHGLVTFVLLLGVIFGVFAVASTIVGVVRHGDSLMYGHKLMLSAQISPTDLAPLPRGLRFITWPEVRLEIAPTTRQMLLRSAMDIVPLALLLSGLWLVRGFLRSVLVGDPFGADNVRRLRAIGLLLVVGVPIVEVIFYALRLALTQSLQMDPSVDLAFQGFPVPGVALLGGLAVFVLAEVFAYGLRLREDVEGTI